MRERKIQLKPSPADQKALNSAAERLESLIKEKVNAMRKAAKLPNKL